MPEQPPEFNPPKVRFDTTINLGHVLTAVVMMGTVLSMWASSKVSSATQDSRITVHDQALAEIRTTLGKLADSEAANQRTNDRLVVTMEFLSKQVANKP